MKEKKEEKKIIDVPKQRARYHALLELLGFHNSFEEIVKRKESSGAPCMTCFSTESVCCSLLIVTVYGEA